MNLTLGVDFVSSASSYLSSSCSFAALTLSFVCSFSFFFLFFNSTKVSFYSSSAFLNYISTLRLAIYILIHCIRAVNQFRLPLLLLKSHEAVAGALGTGA